MTAVVDDGAELRSWLLATGAEAIMLRPDRYVLGAARSAEEMNLLAAAV